MFTESKLDIMSGAPTSVLGQITGLTLGGASVSNIQFNIGGTTQMSIDSNGNIAASNLVSSGQTVMRNRLVNGGLQIDQRYAGSNAVCVGNTAASASNAAYGPDRWQASMGANSGFLAAQQVPLSTADQAAIGGVSTKAVAITPAVMPNLTTGLTTLVTFEGSNAVDTLGGATGPTWTGTPAFTTGIIGSTAVNLTANTAGSASPSTYMTYGYSNTSTTVSVVFWVRVASVPSANSSKIVSIGSSTVSNLDIALTTESKLYCDFYNVSNNYNTSTTGGTPIPANTWTHVCATFTAGSATGVNIYVNGLLYQNATTVGAPSTLAITMIRVGCHSALSDAFSGYLDDLRIYNRVLTAQEVTALYNYNGNSIPMQVSSSLLSGLVAYIPFEAGSVQDVLGTLTAPVWTGTPAFSTGKVGSTALNLSANTAGALSSASTAYVQYTTNGVTALPLTCSAWVYPMSVSVAMCIFSFAGPNDGDWAFDLVINASGQVYTDLSIGTVGSSSTTSYGIAGAAATLIPNNTWTHISFTINLATQLHVLYFNGVQIATKALPSSGVMVSNQSPYRAVTQMRLGTRGDGNYNAFQGYMDDLRIYNRALTAAEIGLLASNTPAMAIPNSIPFTNTSQPTGLISQFTLNNTLADAQGINTLSTTGSISYVSTLTGKAAYFANEANTNNTVASQTFSSNYLTSSYTPPTNFTASMWFNANKSTYNMLFITNSAQSSITNCVVIYIDGINQAASLWGAFNNTANTGTGYPITLGKWYHVAVTYANGTAKWYANGVQFGNSLSYTYATNGFALGGGNSSGTYFPYSGYQSDFRLYNTALTQGQIAAIYSAGADNYASSLVSYYPFEPVAPPTSGLTTLLTFDSTTADAQGTLSAPTVTGAIRDLSSNNLNLATALKGNVASSSTAPATFPSTEGSIYFDGGSSSYIDSGLLFNWWQNGGVTVEAWVNISTWGSGSSSSSTQYAMMGFMSPTNASGNWTYILGITSSGNLNLFWVGESTDLVTSNTIPLNTWTHIAMTCDGSTNRLFINGVLGASVAVGSPTGPSSPGTFCIGGRYGNQMFTGYLSNIRVVSGAALYTANFTPPTAILTATPSSGTTKLLLRSQPGGWFSTSQQKIGTACLDLTANANPGFTANNTPAYALFYPATSPSVNCTVSFWMNMSSTNPCIVACFGTVGTAGTNSGGQINLVYNGGLYANWNIGGTEYAGSPAYNTISSAFSSGTWYHIAFTTQPSSYMKLYVNGALVGTSTVLIPANAAFSAGQITLLSIGCQTSGWGNFKGYVDDFRIYNRALSATEIAQIAGNYLYDVQAANPLTPTGTMQYVGGRVATQALYLANEGNVLATTTKASNYAQFSSLSTAQPLSVAGWFYVTKAPLSGNLSTIWEFGTTSTESVQLTSAYVSTSQLLIYPWAGNGSTLDGTVMNINTWYHMVVTYVPSTSFTFYVNGVLVMNHTSSVTAGAASQLFYIGDSTRSDLKRPFAGYVDDLRIYNKALAASDVATLYYAGQPNAYALYQQPIEGQNIVDLALGTSASSSMTVSAWLKNNTATAQSFSLALNAANPGLTTWIPFENGSAADVMGTATGPVATGALTLSSSTYKIGSSAANLTANTANSTAVSALVYNNISVPSAFSVSFWANPSTIGVSYQGMVCLTAPGSSYGYDIALNSSGVYIDAYISSANSTNAITATAAGPISANAWSFVVATMSATPSAAGYNSLYINGVLVSSVSIGSGYLVGYTSSNAVSTMTIGAFPGGTLAYKGYIDDVRIYNSALSAAQVQQLYQNNANSTTLSSYLLPRSVVYQTPSISANSWQKLAFSVPGDLLGTYSTDTTKTLTLALCLGAGANCSTSNVAAASNNSSNVWQNALVYNASGVQILGASSNNFLASPYNSVYLTGVQLEKGTLNTPFEVRPAALELGLCQRYFEKSYSQADALGTVTANNAVTWAVVSGNRPSFGVQYKTVKRTAAPTITVYNPNSGSTGTAQNNDASTNGSVTLERQGDAGFGMFWPSGNSGQTQGQMISAHFAADAEI